jgi:hypothetical protein
MTITIQQTEVHLRYGDELVKFHWPKGSDLVEITSTLGKNDGQYSVEEASELFDKLLDMGAY